MHCQLLDAYAIAFVTLERGAVHADNIGMAEEMLEHIDGVRVPKQGRQLPHFEQQIRFALKRHISLIISTRG